MSNLSTSKANARAILVIDDERRFSEHPKCDEMIFASNWHEGISLLNARDRIDLYEIWLDFVLKPGDIFPVLQHLKDIAAEDPGFVDTVVLRTTTQSDECARIIRQWLEPAGYRFERAVIS